MKIFWKRGEIATKEQFLLFSTIFCCLLVDLSVKTGARFSVRDNRLFEISEVEITRVDCMCDVRGGWLTLLSCVSDRLCSIIFDLPDVFINILTTLYML